MVLLTTLLMSLIYLAAVVNRLKIVFPYIKNLFTYVMNNYKRLVKITYSCIANVSVNKNHFTAYAVTLPTSSSNKLHSPVYLFIHKAIFTLFLFSFSG